MNWKILFKRKLDFRDKLKRLHLVNGFLFFMIMICGFFLISTAFEEAYPLLRYAIKHVHYFIGTLILLAILFYLPKMKTHLKLLKKRKFNIVFVLAVLLSLISTGFTLAFFVTEPSSLRSAVLLVHDISFFLIVPFTIYHAVSRTLYFKRLATKKSNEGVENNAPAGTEIENY